MSGAAVVGTRHRFTVSAWVRLDSLASTGVAVSQDGNNRSGFNLGYLHDQAGCPHQVAGAKGTGCFAMWAPGSDAAGDVPIATAMSPEPVVAGDWYVLVGVYNEAAPAGEELRICSCNTSGFVQETGAAGRSAGWRASGPLRVGQGELNDAGVDPWQGDVDTVTVCHGAMDEGGVASKCAGA